MKNKSSILLIILALAVTVSAQTNLIPEKYLQIKPAVSTREDVEKIYGRDNLKESMILYKTADGVVNITYSTGSCDAKNTKWNLPEWTVEQVFFVPGGIEPLRLGEVLLDTSKFKSKSVGIVLNQIEYSNEDAGISLTYFKDNATVQDITLSLTSEQKRQFACADVKTAK